MSLRLILRVRAKSDSSLTSRHTKRMSGGNSSTRRGTPRRRELNKRPLVVPVEAKQPERESEGWCARPAGCRGTARSCRPGCTCRRRTTATTSSCRSIRASSSRTRWRSRTTIRRGTFWYHSHAHMDLRGAGVRRPVGHDHRRGAHRAAAARTARRQGHRASALKDAQVVGDDIETENIDSNAPTLRVVNSASHAGAGDRAGRGAALAAREHRRRHLVRRRARGSAVRRHRRGRQPGVGSLERRAISCCRRASASTCSSPGPPAGDYVFRTREYDQGGDKYPAGRPNDVHVDGRRGRRRRRMPTSLVPADEIPDERRRASAARWCSARTRRRTTFFINGKSFDPNRVDVQPKLGTVEEWTLKNTSRRAAPVPHPRQRLPGDLDRRRALRRAVACRTPCRSSRARTSSIRTRFTDFTGKFVFHCHILNHEDNGMMAVVKVAE